LRLNLIADEKKGKRSKSLSTEGLGKLVARIPVQQLIDVVDMTLGLLDADRDQSVKLMKQWDKDHKTVSKHEFEFQDRTRARMRQELARLFDNSLSVYRMRVDGCGLERRSDPIATDALEEVVAAAVNAPAGSAAAHLQRAWNAVHSIHPEPGIAYGEAIKAVEAAAHAVLEPNNSRATLGTMLRTVRDHPNQFSMAIAGRDGAGDASPLIANMKLLWEGQTSRHGSQVTTREETLEEAAMAVSLAVLLVGWFASGAIRRRYS
jgi:hypothetical protein